MAAIRKLRRSAETVRERQVWAETVDVAANTIGGLMILATLNVVGAPDIF